MASSVQELAGLTKALDRLEARIKSYRAILLDMSLGRSVKATNEDDAISTGEVETVEALVRRFARRVTGADPAESEWEPLHPYCSRNEDKGKGSWADQNYEYFRWALLWLKKDTHVFGVLEWSASRRGRAARVWHGALNRGAGHPTV